MGNVMMQSGRILRWAPWLVSLAFLSLCLWLAYHLIDQAITIDHMSQQLRFTEGRQNLLLAVVNSLLPGTDEAEMRQLLADVSSYEPFDKGENAMVADQVMFVFQDGVFLRAE